MCVSFIHLKYAEIAVSGHLEGLKYQKFSGALPLNPVVRYISIFRYAEELLTKIHQHSQLIRIRAAEKQRVQSTKVIT